MLLREWQGSKAVATLVTIALKIKIMQQMLQKNEQVCPAMIWLFGWPSLLNYFSLYTHVRIDTGGAGQGPFLVYCVKPPQGVHSRDIVPSPYGDGYLVISPRYTYITINMYIYIYMYIYILETASVSHLQYDGVYMMTLTTQLGVGMNIKSGQGI